LRHGEGCAQALDDVPQIDGFLPIVEQTTGKPLN
jgi:hypothetical protein